MSGRKLLELTERLTPIGWVGRGPCSVCDRVVVALPILQVEERDGKRWRRTRTLEVCKECQ